MEIKPERVFTVDGKPFYPLGGQARNSSGYNAQEFEPTFQALELLHGNTLEIPVYWEQVEPTEGSFDFSSVGALLEAARQHGVHLLLLWFGTWKNGNMEYVPAWVKTQPQRFKRVTSPTGRKVWVLSSHCAETLDVDRRAFTELCRYLKDHDGDEGTVIGLQIENEPGILGSDRDYGPEAQQTFGSPVPDTLMDKLGNGEGVPVQELWQQAGGQKGSWEQVFGPAAGELFTAWSIARYIDTLAEAGKAIYEVPMTLNVWLGESGWRVPGESYPSGGAVSKVLDVYKWATPHIDIIAPDIYITEAQSYKDICAAYARADNPLFVPESGPRGANAWNMFQAIGEYGAIGYAFFAIEHILDQDGDLQHEARMLVESFHAVAAALPLLLRYQGSDRIHTVVQAEHEGQQYLDLGRYRGLVEFESAATRHHKDWRHRHSDPQQARRGRGLIFHVDEHEFYLVGADYRLLMRPDEAPAAMLDVALSNERLLTRLAHYVRVEEGHFDDAGVFVADRQRNGDETDAGVWVTPDVGVVHVVLCE